MKIGIMGGTFDPVHNAHMMLAEYALREYQLDEVWFMPNGNPPHKQNNQKERTDAEIRAEMVRLAIAGKNGFRLEEYEIRRKEISYSYETMEHFRNIYPEHHFYFIIGADSLFSIESWVHPERLLRTCTILAACRAEVNRYDVMEEKIRELNQKYQSDIRLLITPVMGTASQDLRQRVKNGESIADDVPEAVEEYIVRHHLYQSQSVFEKCSNTTKRIDLEI